MTDAREFKDAAYQHLANVGKALSDPTRIELLEVIAQLPKSVDELATAVAQSVANTSHHLQVLKRNNLVVSRPDGPRNIYSLASPQVAVLVDALQCTAQRQIAELRALSEQFFGERDGLEPIEADELLRRLSDEDALLIDVRPPTEFDADHIPGALSVPVSELADYIEKLPRTRMVVAYCRGPFCAFSADAVTMLRAHGFEAVRFEGSVSQAKTHWETVYGDKETDSVSWYRPHLDRSLEYIEEAELPDAARLVDIGGGASTWADDLLFRGYENLAVLDISEKALNRSIERLGAASVDVDWVVGDVLDEHFPQGSVDLWHDRAVLHFMNERQALTYRDRVIQALKPGGYAIIATFAPDGPTRCSGLDVTRYSAGDLAELFGDTFELLKSTEDVHITPWGTQQRFTYVLLRLSDRAQA